MGYVTLVETQSNRKFVAYKGYQCQVIGPCNGKVKLQTISRELKITEIAITPRVIPGYKLRCDVGMGFIL